MSGVKEYVEVPKRGAQNRDVEHLSTPLRLLLALAPPVYIERNSSVAVAFAFAFATALPRRWLLLDVACQWQAKHVCNGRVQHGLAALERNCIARAAAARDVVVVIGGARWGVLKWDDNVGAR